mgnify:CR=1 FL=1
MGMAGAIQAGGAYVEVAVRGRQKASRELDRVEKKVSKFGRACRRAGRAMRGMAKGAGKIGGTALGVAGGMGLSMGAKSAGKMAKGVFKTLIASANEAEATFTRMNMIFRENSAEAGAWAAKISDSLKRTKTQAAGTLTTFQTLFTGLGFGAEESMKLSKATTRLSFDFGAFTKQTDPEMMRRFVAALAGSPEVLDQFGVNIKQAALDVKLLEMGMRTVANGATEQEKTIARLSIIYGAMSAQGALGAAQKMASTFSQEMTRMKNMITETAAVIGAHLLPKLKPVISLMRDFAIMIRDVVSEGNLFAGLGDMFGSTFSDLFKDLRAAVDTGDLNMVVEMFWLKFKIAGKQGFAALGNLLWDALKGALGKLVSFLSEISGFNALMDFESMNMSLKSGSSYAKERNKKLLDAEMAGGGMKRMTDEEKLAEIIKKGEQRREYLKKRSMDYSQRDRSGDDYGAGGMGGVFQGQMAKMGQSVLAANLKKEQEAHDKLLKQFGEQEIMEALKTGKAINRVRMNLNMALQQHVKKAVDAQNAREHNVAMQSARRISGQLQLQEKIQKFIDKRKGLIGSEIDSAMSEGRAPDMVRVQMQMGLAEWTDMAKRQMEQTGRVDPGVQGRIKQLQGCLDTSSTATGGKQFGATTNAFKAALMGGGSGTLLAEKSMSRPDL